MGAAFDDTDEAYAALVERGAVSLSAPHDFLQSHRVAWVANPKGNPITANRVWCFQLWMGEGSPELAPIMHWDPADKVEQSPLVASELVVGLESTWGMIADALARWTAADLERVFPPPASLSEEEKKLFGAWTRQRIIWHVLEHEIHHGGELSLALGGYGLEGVYGNA
jgi:hypothetical protein